MTGFFRSFFCTVFSFNSFFFKVHLVDNFNKIWFHLFLFTHPSYMELSSWKTEMLTIMKWTQKDTVLKLLCLTLKLFRRDFHLSLIMTTTATITLHLKTDALMQRKFWCLKRNETLLLIREFVCFSVKREWQRMSGTILDQNENSLTWNERNDVAFACKLQCHVIIWKKALTNFLNNLLVPIGSAFLKNFQLKILLVL